MSAVQQTDLLDVLLALEERIMRRLQVASFGIVTNLDTSKKQCYVRTFPIDEEDKSSEIVCVYSDSLEADLVVGSVVIVLYMDKDFRKNLQLVLSGDKLSRLASSNTLHGDSNAVIIQVYKKEEVI